MREVVPVNLRVADIVEVPERRSKMTKIIFFIIGLVIGALGVFLWCSYQTKLLMRVEVLNDVRYQAQVVEQMKLGNTNYALKLENEYIDLKKTEIKDN